MRRRLLDHTYKKTVTGNPVIARSVARMYPDISFPGFTTQDGEPSPENPVDIVNAQSPVQVEVMGGNLFDIRLIEDLPESEILKAYHINMRRSGWYTCSCNIPIAGGVANIFFVAGKASVSSASSSVNGVSNKKNVSVNSSDGWVTIIARSNGSNPNDPRNFDIAINVGETALPYEPYKQPQTVTITSDRPITKWDKLIKQNGVWGWMYKSEHMVLNGEMEWVFSKLYNKFLFDVDKKPVMNLDGGLFSNKLYCSHFLPDTKAYYDKQNVIGCTLRRESTRIIFVVKFGGDSSVNSIENLKKWLSENVTRVLYETENTEFVPLPQEQQDQLNALHTNNPTTIVQNNIGTDVTLTYKTKRSLEVTQ